MKDIRGHKSRNQGEIIEILNHSGSYTCPTLPHYRYDRVKETCWRLRKAGLLRISGRNPESINLTVTSLFREWQTAVRDGETNLGVLRWVKTRHPSRIGAADGER